MKKNKNSKTAEKLLPKAYRPLSPWKYLLLAILYSIPVVGWLFMIGHAFADKSRHVRSFACGYIFLTLLAVAGVLAYSLLLG